MKIDFHKDFEKGFLKLTLNQQKRIDQALEIFENNPHDPQIKNHPLQGDQKGRRSMAAGGDLRLVFRVENSYERVIFLSVGTYNQVY